MLLHVYEPVKLVNPEPFNGFSCTLIAISKSLRPTLYLIQCRKMYVSDCRSKALTTSAAPSGDRVRLEEVRTVLNVHLLIAH